jgi:2-dehydro-3-deoxyphosphooctonate aldolase (KDO 8-P synthase)
MLIISGPCQHESLEQSLEIAQQCFEICKQNDVDYYFKASFDKANRTHVNGKRGLGFKKTMEDFSKIKDAIPQLKILTDVHNVTQVMMINEGFSNEVDVIQIPAFLCRQTDLIVAACKTGKTVNIKKGQFLAPWDIAGILSKTSAAKEIWITERGTSFGYNNLVVDFTGMQYIMDNFDCRFVFDSTHSVQQPGGNGSSSSGNRNYVPGLCRAASAMGVDSFFLEVHSDPDTAASDGPNMIRLDDFENLVQEIVEFHYEKRSSNTHTGKV